MYKRQLCHGVGLDHTMWDRQVTALAPYFRVVRYDMFGHGRTAARPDVTAIGDFVAQLKELLDSLEISKLTLVGMSMGGIIAQGFAANSHERLDKLILMTTVYRRTEAELEGVRKRLKITVDEGLEPVADLAVERWFDDAFRQANPDVVTRIKIAWYPTISLPMPPLMGYLWKQMRKLALLLSRCDVPPW